MGSEPRSLEYVRAHLEESLATDPRVADQGTHVVIEHDSLVVLGTVSTRQRRAAIDDVVREVAPGVPVQNETTVVALEEPHDEKSIS
jgi:hypothetical protein